MEEHKQAKEQIILEYDKQLSVLHEQLDEIEKNMERSKKLDLNLIKIQNRLTNEWIRLSMKKFEVEMQPTLDPKLNKIIIKSLIENNGHLDEDHIINFLMDNH